MLTILCSSKPFVGEAAWNQINAYRSWRAIHPNVEIVIFGDSPGVGEAAKEIGAKVISVFETSPSGAPSFNAMVAYADAKGRNDLILYANSDILLNSTIILAMQVVRQRFDKFLLVGERLDLGEGAVIDTRRTGWMSMVISMDKENKLVAHGPTGADYFGFTRNMWDGLAQVFMGRGLCDQALLHHCLRRGIPIVDGTLAVVNLHQHHGYQHVSGGKREAFWGEDRDAMALHHGLKHSLPTISDAPYRLDSEYHFQKGRIRRRHLRNLELRVRYVHRRERLALAIRALERLGGARKLKAFDFTLEEISRSWQKSVRKTEAEKT
jgi:hypothetical protein